jgi:hypothetical protein
MPESLRILRSSLLVAAVASSTLASARAQQHPSVIRGVDFLRASSRTEGAGESALALLALLKAEVPRTDPAVAALTQRIEARFQGSAYRPERSGGTEIYEAGVVIMALATLDAAGRKAQIDAVAQYILSQQRANGSWDYSGRNQGDSSITQYATLGLWEAENAGARVPGRTWDRIAQFYLATQGPSGGWNYHRDEAGYPDTLSMTAAGVGSLLICDRQLAPYRKNTVAGSKYLVPVLTDAQRERYSPETPSARIQGAANRGMTWISGNLNFENASVVGPSAFYMLYGIERLGSLSGRTMLGRVDWYSAGANYISSRQAANGALNSAHGETCNTAWGVLFLVRATKKTVERITIRRLAAGELFGGMGLPQDLSSISVAAGRVVARPMDGAVEGMLTVLEDPRAANADSALAGLVTRYRTLGPRALTPYRDRFQRLLADPDPGVRKVAAWALGRMNDITNVPLLIGALSDSDEGVVLEARSGLRLAARMLDGFGPPDGATPEQREAAARAWSDWYRRIRPLTVDQVGDLLDTPAGNVGPATKEAKP